MSNVISLKTKIASHIDSAVMKITPELAMEWLEKKAPNRPIREASVLQYADSMRSGLWMLSPQPIAFDKDGMLMDGQHRLWAVIESARTIESLVTWGYDRAAMLVQDQGTKRSAADNWNLSHSDEFKITNDDVAVLRRVVVGNGYAMRIPPEIVSILLPQYMEGISFAKECFGGRTSKPATIVVRAVVARASYTRDHDRLKQFGKVMMDGVAAKNGDKAAIRLRDLIIGEWSQVYQAPQPAVVYAKIQGALANFLDGKAVDKLMGMHVEQFPIPRCQQLIRLQQLHSEASILRRANKRKAAKTKIESASND